MFQKQLGVLGIVFSYLFQVKKKKRAMLEPDKARNQVQTRLLFNNLHVLYRSFPNVYNLEQTKRFWIIMCGHARRGNPNKTTQWLSPGIAQSRLNSSVKSRKKGFESFYFKRKSLWDIVGLIIAIRQIGSLQLLFPAFWKFLFSDYDGFWICFWDKYIYNLLSWKMVLICKSGFE